MPSPIEFNVPGTNKIVTAELLSTADGRCNWIGTVEDPDGTMAEGWIDLGTPEGWSMLAVKLSIVSWLEHAANGEGTGDEMSGHVFSAEIDAWCIENASHIFELAESLGIHNEDDTFDPYAFD